jgi:hypothetical protein
VAAAKEIKDAKGRASVTQQMDTCVYMKYLELSLSNGAHLHAHLDRMATLSFIGMVRRRRATLSSRREGGVAQITIKESDEGLRGQ